MALCILSGTTQVSWYQKKHSPTHTDRGHPSSLMCFLRLLQSMASSLFNLHAWQSFCTISQAGCPSCRPTNSVKALKANTQELKPWVLDKV